MTKTAQRRVRISGVRLGAVNAALTLAVVLLLGLAVTQSAQAQTFTVLYNFTGSPDGANPFAGLDVGNSKAPARLDS